MQQWPFASWPARLQSAGLEAPLSITSPAPASRVGRKAGGSAGCVALMDFSAQLMQCQAMVLLFRVTEGSSAGQSRGLITPG